jgi:hypothetical protein
MPTTPNVENVKLGASGVTWGADDLGFTKGGIDVAISTMTKEVTVDQFGPAAINEYIQGRSVTVTVPMAESDLPKLALAIPGSVLTGAEGGPRKLVVKNAAGTNLRELAKKLVLHPTGVPASQKNDDFVVLIAAPVGDIEFSYNFEDERVYSVTFKGYPDNATGELFVFGDESAVAP